MSEMVERVADAIHKAFKRFPDFVSTHEMARAAIAAMREDIVRIILEQRCERNTPWDLACTTIAEKVATALEPVDEEEKMA